jgi:hypothetical protein
MKKDWIIISILAGIVFVLIAFRKPIKKFMTRGYKNKNPGNIRLTSGIPWKGEIKGTDKDFKTFKSMGYGYRAILVTLNSYFKKGFNTIEKIISRYAPGSENNTQAYINTVVNQSGIAKDTVLDFNDKLKIRKIIEAISYVENGIKANPLEIDEGFKLYQA